MGQEWYSAGIIKGVAKRFHLKSQILSIGHGCLELWTHRMSLRLRERDHLD